MREHRSSQLAASPWVTRFLAGVAPGGRVLDLACGAGRHLALCHERGLPALGIDRDLGPSEHLAGTPGVTRMAADLETGAPPPFAGERFDGVIVANYLWRPLLPAIVQAVAPGGILIYETFALGNERYGRPSNPEFLLRPAELLDTVRGHLVPVAYEHVRLTDPDRLVQRLCAVGARHPWAADGAAPA